VLSVIYDGYGLYILEANSVGIPVVQPSTGAFPEIIEKTGGRINLFTGHPFRIYQILLLKILSDNDLRRSTREKW
jgi:glycosyltransferase involved in cell wall biosynthesis